MPGKRTVRRPANQLRIIAGRWRGRKLAFPDVANLRPTPDRVRETLFNWLAPVIEGARCLDLFAGSGALGFEAASRGARAVVLVERALPAVTQLRAHIETLQAAQVRVVQTDALGFLNGTAQPFDVVLLDPPYDQPQLLAECCARLEAGGWLAPQAHIYLEARAGQLPALPATWRALHDKRAGQVGYHLYARV